MKITPVGIMKWAGSLFCATLVILFASAVILNLGRSLHPDVNSMSQFGLGSIAFLFTAAICAFIMYLFVEAMAEIINRKKIRNKVIKNDTPSPPFVTTGPSYGKGLRTGISEDVIRAGNRTAESTGRNVSHYERDPSSQGDHLLVVRKPTIPNDEERLRSGSEC